MIGKVRKGAGFVDQGIIEFLSVRRTAAPWIGFSRVCNSRFSWIEVDVFAKADKVSSCINVSRPKSPIE
jgi:hypothetical protein